MEKEGVGVIYRILRIIKKHPYAAALVGGDILLLGSAVWIIALIAVMQRKVNIAILEAPFTADNTLSQSKSLILAAFCVSGVCAFVAIGLVVYGAHGLLKNVRRRSSG
jgi:hypothetical protein